MVRPDGGGPAAEQAAHDVQSLFVGLDAVRAAVRVAQDAAIEVLTRLDITVNSATVVEDALSQLGTTSPGVAGTLVLRPPSAAHDAFSRSRDGLCLPG